MGRTLQRATAFTALGRALTARAKGGPSLGKRIGALPRMIRAIVRREYDGGVRLLLMAAGLVYVISPIDFIPEAALLLVGLADDALIVAWLAGALISETDRFLEWERNRDAIPGRVVRGRH